MELFDLYDVNRKPLGLTMERGGVQPKGAYRMVVHICIFSSDNKMLCQKRVADKKVYPDKWDLSCGGCVDAGETTIEAAIRETKEELGITLPCDISPSLTVVFNYGFDDVFCVVCDVDAKDVIVQKEEVAEVAWLTLGEIENKIDSGEFIPYDKSYIGYLFYCRDHRGLTDKERPFKGDAEFKG